MHPTVINARGDTAGGTSDDREQDQRDYEEAEARRDGQSRRDDVHQGVPHRAGVAA